MRSITLVALSTLLLASTGCPGEGGGPGPLLQNGATMPETAPDNGWSGNLSDGETMDIDWGSSGGFACWPGTEETNWTGAFVFEDDSLAEGVGDYHVRVTPTDPLVDVSLLAIKVGTDTTEYPPELGSGIACDTSYDRENDSNPGYSEAVIVQGGQNPYRIVVGVAGANGTTSGAYDVEVWYGDGT